MRLLTAIMAAIVAYGSLYPFDFRPAAVFDYDRLLRLDPLDQQLSDIWANVVLFCPLGLTAALSLARIRPRPVGLLLLLGLGLAVVLQVAQLYLPSRVPSGGDVLWNMLGFTGGMAAGALPMVRRQALDVRVRRMPAAAVLAGLWITSQLMPLVPSLDVQNIKNGLKPLLSPQLSLQPIIAGAVGWLAFLHFTGHLGWGFWTIASLMAVTLAAEVPIVGNALDANDLAAAGLALLAWPLVRRPNAGVVAAMVAAFIVWRGLSPFDFQAAPQPFGWLPFAAYIEGSPVRQAEILMEKAFLYGSLVCLLCGFGRPLALFTTVMLLSAVELAQLWVPSHTSEITDPLLALLVGTMLWPPQAHPPDLGSGNTRRVGTRPASRQIV